MTSTRTARATIAGGLVLALGTLGVLAACSDSSSDADASASTAATAEATGDTAADLAALADVVVDGDFGAEPTITLPDTPFTVSATAATLLSAGDGDEIAENDLVALGQSWYDGTDGSSLGSTYTDGDSGSVYAVNDTALPAELVDLLVGGQVGERILFATPGDTAASLAVLDVTDTFAGQAEGDEVSYDDPDLPTVTRDADGVPSVEIPDVDPPTDLVVQTTVQGSGATVGADDTVTVQYSGWVWADGSQFDTSWDDRTPLTSALSGLIEGWSGLVGQQVGSQVMLVIPPDLGYGDSDSGSIPAGSTLVFVVDILYTEPAA